MVLNDVPTQSKAAGILVLYVFFFQTYFTFIIFPFNLYFLLCFVQYAFLEFSPATFYVYEFPFFNTVLNN